MGTILFVCTGNTCRSCMAEAIASKLLKERNIIDVSAASAGIYVINNDKASSLAVRVMIEYGIDLSGHVPMQIDRGIIDNADLILTMTESQKNELKRMAPDNADKVFTLIEYAEGIQADIVDPYGNTIEVYRECANKMERYILKGILKYKSKI